MFCWVIINIAGFAFILRYAAIIRKNPEKSTVRDDDSYWIERSGNTEETVMLSTPVSARVMHIVVFVVLAAFSWFYPMTKLAAGENAFSFPVLPVLTVLFGFTGWIALRKSVHFFIVQLLLFTILILITGVMGYGWYIREIATLFFAMGIVTGITMNYSSGRITKLFLEGVKDIQSAAIIVGLAGGIIIILNNGHIIDTLLYKLSGSISGMGKMASVSMMYVIQNLINLVMPSGSAKAALTMPMMSQLSDLIGVSRQATVMAYQFGDGFTNMITPVSGVLLGVLTVAKIPYEKWFRWVLPLMIILILLGFILLFPTVYMNLKGF
jgi:uncharacterized ion transporter superfamily protein YfcC